MTASGGAPELASERALLGAAMTSTDLALAVVERIQPRHLKDPAHQRILETVVDLIGRGQQMSPGVLLVELQKVGALTGRLDGLYLNALFEERALPRELDYHTKHVRDRVWKSGLWLLGSRLQQAAENHAQTPDEDAELVHAWLDDLFDSDTGHGTVEAADRVLNVVDEIQAGSDEDVVTTGFADLDALMSIRPGDLIVVGARPGTGKTTFGMDVARHNGVKLHKPVYFLTLEMPANNLIKRMIAAEAGVSLHAILHHRTNRELLTEPDWQRMSRAAARIQESKVTIDDAPGAGLARIHARLRHMKRTTGVHAAIIDYLGILKTAGRQENRQQAVAELSRGLKEIARDVGVPIIVLGQLNRQVVGRPDRVPMVSDLKDSGAIEADADAVILLHREDVYEKESPRAGEADLIIGKHRNGPTATITVVFQGHYARFVDFASEPKTDPTPAAKGHLKAVH